MAARSVSGPLVCCRGAFALLVFVVLLSLSASHFAMLLWVLLVCAVRAWGFVLLVCGVLRVAVVAGRFYSSAEPFFFIRVGLGLVVSTSAGYLACAQNECCIFLLFSFSFLVAARANGRILRCR